MPLTVVEAVAWVGNGWFACGHCDCGAGWWVVGGTVVDLACFEVQVGHGFFEVLALDVVGAAHAHVGVKIVVSGLLLQAALFYPAAHQEVQHFGLVVADFAAVVLGGPVPVH